MVPRETSSGAQIVFANPFLCVSVDRIAAFFTPGATAFGAVIDLAFLCCSIPVVVTLAFETALSVLVDRHTYCLSMNFIFEFLKAV